MKIALMGGWNMDSGAAFHTEMVGRSWVKAGHDVKVFSFVKENFHGTNIIGADEPYVTRCFTTWSATPQKLDPHPFLACDYDIFVAEDHGMFPKDQLGKIFNRIRKKAKTIAVVHDGRLSEDPSYYQFKWDAIVSFDRRYIDFLQKGYEQKKLYEIPYPCYPATKGDKISARKKLGIPEERRIVFLFGPSAKTAIDIMPAINKTGRKYPITVLLTTKDKPGIEKFTALRNEMKNIMIEIREEAPDIGRLYDYLHAADVLFFGKKSAEQAVVSSTVYQCLGSGCIVLARDSNYVETFKDAVLKYKNVEDVPVKLECVFNEDLIYKNTLKNAHRFVENNSAEIVAGRFIELFNKLLTEE
jgi:glycosyltransferase involved in cell wall biosynthesis